MDLDSALNELGMLSIVTESRKEYLKELASQNENNMNSAASSTTQQPPSFHVVKMNTQFVTCVGSVLAGHGGRPNFKPSNSSQTCVVEAEKSSSASRPYPPSLINEHRVVRTHKPSRRCKKNKPYSVPHSHRSKASRLRNTKSYLSTSLEDDVFLQDQRTDCNGNGRKYRSPSSETADKGSLTVPSIQLPRSKSLDDLHLERLRLDDGLSRHRSDVELASKLISNLQVS